MSGKDYVAVVDLFSRDENGVFHQVATAGKTCEGVDPRSLPTLLADKDIILAPKKKETVNG